MAVEAAVLIAASAQAIPTLVVTHSGERHGSRRYTVRMRARLAMTNATAIIAMLPVSKESMAIGGIRSSRAA